MKIADLRELLKDKRVIEEINKHLWIESQKAGYSIGWERATDEWLRLHAKDWMKYNMPEKFERMMGKKRKKESKPVVVSIQKKIVKKSSK
ncbi:MAG TPA: hypothetical protein DD723_02640 [Candidatus Omnitrophica bacterium]|nr:MAG: hypothetical protein A2Z81_01640 [Omnitrophica WOR_2 bacterium GWA2_45_18]OGX18510.1 MAG: hypothetical protein A2Y04_03425 [Omnitrophica WOR_2 bacterium GWC2_45_7]HBR14424.1 hypothetical protein [Candidatus Omnitrophota bacterium]